MRWCYTDISKEQLNIEQEMTSKLSEIVKLHGTVAYQDMILHGFLPCAISVNWDDAIFIVTSSFPETKYVCTLLMSGDLLMAGP